MGKSMVSLMGRILCVETPDRVLETTLKILCTWLDHAGQHRPNSMLLDQLTLQRAHNVPQIQSSPVLFCRYDAIDMLKSAIGYVNLPRPKDVWGNKVAVIAGYVLIEHSD